MGEQAKASMRLFYSYSHRDAGYRDEMEKCLSLLQKEGLLQQWSDLQILPGQNISSQIRKKMDEADILVFLLSTDFIVSNECEKEWQYASNMASEGKLVFRVPIVVRQCSWLDMLGVDDVKALPVDGKPVASFADKDEAWYQVYLGIKAIVNELRRTFTPKKEFWEEIQKTEFLSQSHIILREIFEFPRLAYEDPQDFNVVLKDNAVSTFEEFPTNNYVIIYGQEKCGKTALARFLYTSWVGQNKPVLLVDVSRLGSGRMDETRIKSWYEEQFQGDYNLWREQNNKTLIVDNMSSAGRALDLIRLAKTKFDTVILLLSSDTYYSFFKDENMTSEFRAMKIEQLTRVQQESLIRKRLELSKNERPVTDGFVDQVEKHVNGVVVSNRILPRYPFYVLSILQTYEAYMPTNMTITSYGHCYYVLIVAYLKQSGISTADSDVNACFNLLEELASKLYEQRQRHPDRSFDFDEFIEQYRREFMITISVVNRLKQPTYGIIRPDGTFRWEYMYYYFLAKFLARHSTSEKDVINAMCENSHHESNYLTLLFVIHHATDKSIIDDILLRTMVTLEDLKPATLSRDETRRFTDIVNALPDNVLSQKRCTPSEKAVESRAR